MDNSLNLFAAFLHQPLERIPLYTSPLNTIKRNVWFQ